MSTCRFAIAEKITVVTPEWVSTSVETGMWQDEHLFVLNDLQVQRGESVSVLFG
jgi:hypothetical protein